MHSISNIWNHPKTSAAGILIAATTVADVLSRQGITLGAAGTGTVVSLISAAATALLGLLARDPGEAASQRVSKLASQQVSESAGGNTRLGAWMLIVLLLPLPWMEGCNATAVAQDIVNWTPALQSAVDTVDSTVALLAPADAPIFSAATIGFDAASNLLANQAKAYLADPSASTLTLLQTQVTTLEQQVNAALLSAARIVNPASQQHALAAIQAVAAIVSAILALVQSVSSKAAVAHMAAQASIKMSAVRQYVNSARTAQIVAAHYGEPATLARMQMEHAEQNAVGAGF
jgi:hypothetical protein